MANVYLGTTAACIVVGVVVWLVTRRMVNWMTNRRASYSIPSQPDVRPWELWPEVPQKAEGLVSFALFVQRCFPPRDEDEPQPCAVCNTNTGRQNAFYLWETEVKSTVNQLGTLGGVALGLATGLFIISRDTRCLQFVSCHRFCWRCAPRIRWMRRGSFLLELVGKLMVLAGGLGALGLLVSFFFSDATLSVGSRLFFILVGFCAAAVGFCVDFWADVTRHPPALGLIARHPIRLKRWATNLDELRVRNSGNVRAPAAGNAIGSRRAGRS